MQDLRKYETGRPGEGWQAEDSSSIGVVLGMTLPEIDPAGSALFFPDLR
jgi:hypothetical protein